MVDTFLHSGRETLLYAIPTLGLLVIGIFGLEGRMARPKGKLVRQRMPCGVDSEGEPMVIDPDGRVAVERRR